MRTQFAAVAAAERTELAGALRSTGADSRSRPAGSGCGRSRSILPYAEGGAAMTFVWPLALLGLVLVPLAALGYWWAQRRRARYAVRFTNLDLLASVVERSPGWRRHLPPALALLALAALIVGVARPQATP